MKFSLRSAVYGEFKTITGFASALTWDRKKASRIVNGLQRPTADEMEKIADVLKIHDSNTFMQIFFPKMSTMWS